MMIGLMVAGMALATPAPLVAGQAAPGTSPAGEAAPAAPADLREMIAAARASASAAPTGKWDYASYQNGIALEPGIYDAGGISVAGGAIRLVARIPGTVVIRIPEGQYFLTASGHITAITVDGITFVGGKGAFLLTSTGENVTLLHSFTRNLFYNYTECAICNNASDHPYLVARDNVFMGAAGANTIGIGWGGDGPHLIEHNQFLRDAYHLALGPRLGGNIKVRDNDFISWGGTATLADIWIKPNNAPRSYGVNSGGGSLIEGNKFGNENLPPDSPRILIANEKEASGSGRQNRQPDLALDSGYVSGFHFTHNNFGADSHTRAPVIRSVISEIRNWEWRGNSFGGGSYGSIVQFPPSRGANSEYANANSDFEFTEADVVAGGQPALAFSNASFATLRDWAGFFPGDANAVALYPLGDDPGLALLGSDLSAAARRGFGGASIQPIAGPRGAGDYALVSQTAPGGGAYLPLTGAPAAGGRIFIQLDLAKAPMHSAARVLVGIVNPATGQHAFSRRVSLPDSFGRLVTPAFLPASARPEGWQLQVLPLDGEEPGDTAFRTGGWVVNLGPARLGLAGAALATQGAR